MNYLTFQVDIAREFCVSTLNQLKENAKNLDKHCLGSENFNLENYSEVNKMQNENEKWVSSLNRQSFLKKPTRDIAERDCLHKV